MKVLQTSVLALLLSCGGALTLVAQQKPERDVPQQDSGRSPNMKQDKSTGKVEKSTTPEDTTTDNSGANASSKKKKKPHNEQSHGPQHHRPNGQS
jgi:hypothetical protein